MAYFYKGNVIGWDSNTWNDRESGEPKAFLSISVADPLDGDKLKGRKADSFFVSGKDKEVRPLIESLTASLALVKPKDTVFIEYDEAKGKNGGVFKNLRSIEVTGGK